MFHDTGELAGKPRKKINILSSNHAETISSWTSSSRSSVALRQSLLSFKLKVKRTMIVKTVARLFPDRCAQVSFLQSVLTEGKFSSTGLFAVWVNVQEENSFAPYGFDLSGPFPATLSVLAAVPFEKCLRERFNRVHEPNMVSADVRGLTELRSCG